MKICILCNNSYKLGIVVLTVYGRLYCDHPSFDPIMGLGMCPSFTPHIGRMLECRTYAQDRVISKAISVLFGIPSWNDLRDGDTLFCRLIRMAMEKRNG
jgi:hypothetical protein